MNYVTVLIIIVVGVIGGYILGLLDSRFTHFLMGKFEKAKDEGVLLKVTRGKDRSSQISLNNQSLLPGTSLTEDQKTELSAVVNQLNQWLLLEKPKEKKKRDSSTPVVPILAQRLVGDETKPAPREIQISTPSPGLKRNLTLVEMINEELLRRIEGTDFSDFRIKLASRPDHSIFYIVGSETYDEIDQIPNEAIRNLINTTIQDWQKTIR